MVETIATQEHHLGGKIIFIHEVFANSKRINSLGKIDDLKIYPNGSKKSCFRIVTHSYVFEMFYKKLVIYVSDSYLDDLKSYPNGSKMMF